jgi:protein phosphatase
MKLLALGLTDVGLKRENNQDSFLIDQDLGLYIVADGMGGHRGGEVASQMAVENIREVVKQSFEKDKGVKPQELLTRAYQKACTHIFEKSSTNKDLKGMGTTAVAALVRDNKLFVANVGDSRAYLVHSPHIWQITDDHSLLNEQLKSGAIKESQAAQFANKNVITRSVGFEQTVVCDVIERDLQSGEYILMCSDGLSSMVPDQRIGDICLGLPFQDVPGRLIEEAKKSGGDDNITVLLLSAAL